MLGGIDDAFLGSFSREGASPEWAHGDVVSVDMHVPRPILSDRSDGAIRLYGYTVMRASSNRATLEAVPALDFNFEAPRTLETILSEDIKPASHVLTLLLGTAVGAHDLRLGTPDGKTVLVTGHGLHLTRAEGYPRARSAHSLCLAPYLGSAIDLAPDLRVPLELYWRLRYDGLNPMTDAAARFVDLVTIAESALASAEKRSDFPLVVPPDSKKIKAWNDSADLRRKMRSQARTPEEKRLADILLQQPRKPPVTLADYLRAAVQWCVKDKMHAYRIRRSVAKMVTLRNELVHEGHSNTSTHEIVRLHRSLEAIVAGCLLRLLDVPDPILSEIVQCYRPFPRLKRRAH